MKDAYKIKRKVVEICAFPEEYIDDNDLLIPTPQYVKWLEEKIESLQKFPANNI